MWLPGGACSDSLDNLWFIQCFTPLTVTSTFTQPFRTFAIGKIYKQISKLYDISYNYHMSYNNEMNNGLHCALSKLYTLDVTRCL